MRTFLLTLLCLFAANASDTPKQVRGNKDIPRSFIKELESLDKQGLDEEEAQRQLESLFDKYDINKPHGRKLLFFDQLSELNIGELLLDLVVGLLETANDAAGNTASDPVPAPAPAPAPKGQQFVPEPATLPGPAPSVLPAPVPVPVPVYTPVPAPEPASVPVPGFFANPQPQVVATSNVYSPGSSTGFTSQAAPKQTVALPASNQVVKGQQGNAKNGKQNGKREEVVQTVAGNPGKQQGMGGMGVMGGGMRLRN